MQKKISLKIYILLVVVLAVITGLGVYFPQGNLAPAQQLPASKSVMAVVTAMEV